jgi:hypothetical protein
MNRTFRADTPLQALILEHALAMARQLERTATDAPDGKVLAEVEAAALPAARELARKAVEAALQAQADVAEKKAPPPAPARGATRPLGPKGAPPATS